MREIKRHLKGLKQQQQFCNYLSRHKHIVTANAIHPATTTIYPPKWEATTTARSEIASIFRDRDKFDGITENKYRALKGVSECKGETAFF